MPSKARSTEIQFVRILLFYKTNVFQTSVLKQEKEQFYKTTKLENHKFSRNFYSTREEKKIRRKRKIRSFVIRSIFCLVSFIWHNKSQHMFFQYRCVFAISRSPVSITNTTTFFLFSDTNCIVCRPSLPKPKCLKTKKSSPQVAARTNRSAELRKKANEAKLSKLSHES